MSSVTLDDLPPISRLSASVIRILADNPSQFTLQGTNTYLLGTGPRRILLDTGEGRPSWKSRLADTLREEKANIGTVLLTHWHADHVGGLEDAHDVVQDLGGNRSDLMVYKHQPRAGEHDINNGDVFEVQGIKLEAIYTPGHTTDHMVFVDGKSDVMFTGDNVLGHGTAVFEDLKSYISSLEKMKGKFKGKAYPGHGPVVEDGISRINQYIQHRKAREEQLIYSMKSKNDGLYRWTVMETVKIIYKDVPESLHKPAAGGVLQMLQKLQAEGKVEKTLEGEEEKWRLRDRSSI